MTRGDAADVGVPATKFVAVQGATSAKAVLVAKDPAIGYGGGADATTIGVTLDVQYDNLTDAATSGKFVCPAGPPKWVVKPPIKAQYKNSTAPAGGATKSTAIKPGLIKLSAKSLGDVPLDIASQGSQPTGTVRTAYRITDSSNGFDTTYCSIFSACTRTASATAVRVKCKNGVADPACGAVTTTTTTSSSTSSSSSTSTSSSTTTTTIICPSCNEWMGDPCNVPVCQPGCETSPGCLKAQALDGCHPPLTCCSLSAYCYSLASTTCPVEAADCQAN